jgi:hypothetical protein
MKTGGAVALTLASILLLSGVWCTFLSPTVTNYINKDNFYSSISIEALSRWSYNFNVQKGDSIDGSVNGIRLMYQEYSKIVTPNYSFNVKIYDMNNNIVWSRSKVTYAYFNVKAPKSGEYRVEVQNLNSHILDCNIQVTIRGEVTHRPLDPLGQWLSIISIPVFGLGVWTSGVLSRIRERSLISENLKGK